MNRLRDIALHEEPDVTVVVACHDVRRLSRLERALDSLERQIRPAADVVVAVDHNPELAAELLRRRPGLTVVQNLDGVRGASATRNRGVAASSTAFTAFLDDDEIAEPDWLARLLEPFADPAVVGTGGRYAPDWRAGKPGWFPDEFAWVVGGAYTGMPTRTARVRNVWSGNMSVRTAAFRAVGGFDETFGKVGGDSRPEDTDLCIRMAAERGHWMYVPGAVIHHEVTADRSTLRFYLRRCHAEGRGKIEMRDGLGAGALGAESQYLRRVVPLGVVAHLKAGPRGAVRAAAILLGLAWAGAGATGAVVRRRRARPRAAGRKGAARSVPTETTGAVSR